LYNANINFKFQDGTFFHLLYFPFFNNSFALDAPQGCCSKHQMEGIKDDWYPDPDQLTYCVCCDDYEPDTLSGCPANPWSNKGKELGCFLGNFFFVFRSAM
jgi:hypothetical protein